jgi:hypothetical protein
MIVARVITVNDVLDGHVVLDIECLDRIYLNAYVPILQTSSQVVAFLSGHLGFPFPLPGAVPADGRPVPPVGAVVRRCQRHPVDQVR